jgi:hypothetical protein
MTHCRLLASYTAFVDTELPAYATLETLLSLDAQPNFGTHLEIEEVQLHRHGLCLTSTEQWYRPLALRPTQTNYR